MASDAAIGALIVDHPLCLECIAAKIDARLTDVDDALTRIAKVTLVSVVPRSTCRECGNVRVTVCIGVHEGAAGGGAGTADEETRSGPRYCAWCGSLLEKVDDVRVELGVAFHAECLDARERILTDRPGHPDTTS